MRLLTCSLGIALMSIGLVARGIGAEPSPSASSLEGLAQPLYRNNFHADLLCVFRRRVIPRETAAHPRSGMCGPRGPGRGFSSPQR